MLKDFSSTSDVFYSPAKRKTETLTTMILLTEKVYRIRWKILLKIRTKKERKKQRVHCSQNTHQRKKTYRKEKRKHRPFYIRNTVR